MRSSPPGCGTGCNEFFVGFETTSESMFYVGVDQIDYYFNGPTDFFDQAWHHIMVTYNTSVIAVYLDGALYNQTQQANEIMDFAG